MFDGHVISTSINNQIAKFSNFSSFLNTLDNAKIKFKDLIPASN